MAVRCQNLPLGALGGRSAPSVLVDVLFKKFGLFLNTLVCVCVCVCVCVYIYICIYIYIISVLLSKRHLLPSAYTTVT